MASKSFFRTNIGIFIVRLLASTVLVLATFTPTNYCLFHWVKSAPNLMDARIIFAIVVTIALHAWIWYAVIKGLGKFGMVLVAAILGAGTFLAFQENWVSGSPVSLQWLGVILTTATYTAGLCFAIFYRRMTGQVVADTDVED